MAKSPRAREILEVARLNGAAAQAFDAGDADLGRRLARQAVAKLAALESEEMARGNQSGRAQLALQRAKLLLESLGYRAADKDALLDALASDAQNDQSQRALVAILEREDAEAAQARRTAP